MPVSHFLVQHAKRFGPKATLDYAAWKARDRLLGYMPYRGMILAGDPQTAPRNAGANGGIEVREVVVSELQPYVADPAYDLSERSLSEASDPARRCVGAFAGRKLVAYGFTSTLPTMIDADFRFHFPQGWVYQYKAFVLPQWRGSGVHARLIAMRRSLIAGPLGGVVTLVVATNYPSVSSLLRSGYRPAFDFVITGKHAGRRLNSEWAGQGPAGDGSSVTFRLDPWGLFTVSRIR